jgi:hypothetical protein
MWLVACSLAHMEQEMHKLRNRMNQLADAQRQPPASSVVTTDSVTHAYRRGIIDRHLRELQKFLIFQGQALTTELKNELTDPASSLTRTKQAVSLRQMAAANINGFLVANADVIPFVFISIQSRLCDQIQHGLVGAFWRVSVDDGRERIF